MLRGIRGLRRFRNSTINTTSQVAVLRRTTTWWRSVDDRGQNNVEYNDGTKKTRNTRLQSLTRIFWNLDSTVTWSNFTTVEISSQKGNWNYCAGFFKSCFWRKTADQISDVSLNAPSRRDGNSITCRCLDVHGKKTESKKEKRWLNLLLWWIISRSAAGFWSLQAASHRAGAETDVCPGGTASI